MNAGFHGLRVSTAVLKRATLAPALVLAGCISVQVYPTLQEQDISLRTSDVAAHGIAFITPSTATGQEEEKQALALIFAKAFKEQRPHVRIVSLAESLNAVNRAGLSEAYKQMYNDYRDTALFKRDTLSEVGKITGARYIAQIKLQSFNQGSKERFSAFGLRLVETRSASVRIFFQIWDSRDGTIAWEGMQEMIYAREQLSEEPVTLQMALERTARDLIARLP